MQQKNKNPFEVLGIRPAEAAALNSSSKTGREQALTAKRRYFANVYSGGFINDLSMENFVKEINIALDGLDNDEKFSQAYQEYQTMSRQTGTSGSRDVKQAQYLKSQAEERFKEAEQMANIARGKIEESDVTILGLEQSIGDLQQKNWDLERTLKGLKARYANFRNRVIDRSNELRDEYRERFLSDLIGGSKIPDDASTLDQLIGMELYVKLQKDRAIEGIFNVRSLNSMAYVVRTDNATREHTSAEEGYLIGGIDDREVSRLIQGTKPLYNGLVTPKTKKFDHILINNKPYLKLGMHPVMAIESYGGTNLLYVFGEITDIVKPLLK